MNIEPVIEPATDCKKNTEVAVLKNYEINAGNLLLKAIEKGMDVASIEKLVTLCEKMQLAKAKSEFLQAFAGFQGDCPVIIKKKIVKDKYGNERYKYAPIDDIVDQVKPHLKKWGISYIIKTVQSEKGLTAICYVNHVAGFSKKSELTVPIEKDAYKSAPQHVASARTFAARYAFCGALGIMTGDEDDDANLPIGNLNGDTEKKDLKKPQDQNLSLKQVILSIKDEKEKIRLFDELKKARNIKDEIQKTNKISFIKKEVEACLEKQNDMKTLSDDAEKGFTSEYGGVY